MCIIDRNAICQLYIHRENGWIIRKRNKLGCGNYIKDGCSGYCSINISYGFYFGRCYQFNNCKANRVQKVTIRVFSKKREKPYEAFIAMVYRLIQSSQNLESYSEEEMTKDVMSFSQELTLWGSKKVARKWIKFRREVNDPDVAIKRLVFLESIMNEMRRDMGVKRMKKGGLLSFFIRDIDNINAVNGK